MNMLRNTILGLAVCLPLLACSQPTAASTEQDKGLIARHVDKALDKARKELREGNLSLNNHGTIQVNGTSISKGNASLPKAEITPKGDLLIEGKAIAINEEQRQQVLAYRGQIIAIAEDGMAIGSQGAALASKAIGGVWGVIFGGEKKEQEFEARMEAESQKIERQAAQICTRLPKLMASQQALAATLPAFKPYATMTQGDIDDCAKDVQDQTAQAKTTAANSLDAVQAVNTAKAPEFPAFAKRKCDVQRPIDLALDTQGIKIVQLRIGSDDLHAEAVAGGAKISGTACASNQERLDDLRVVQSRQGDKLIVSVESKNSKNNVNINMGPIQYQRYAFAQLHAQVPDDVLVQVVAGSGNVIVHNAKRASVDLGSGDAKVYATHQDVHAQIGSGDLLVDSAGSLRILGIGSGDAVIRNIAGATRVEHVGSGDLKLSHGGSVQIGAVGSGDVSVNDINGSLHISAIGSGDVVAKNINGDLTVDAIGSGDVTHRGVSGKVNLPKQD